MAGFAHDGRAGHAVRDINRVPGEAWIVNNFASRFSVKKRLCQQSNNVVTLNKSASRVEEETAVKVAVPGNT